MYFNTLKYKNINKLLSGEKDPEFKISLELRNNTNGYIKKLPKKMHFKICCKT